MDPEDLERNFVALINDIYTQKPKRQGDFATRYVLKYSSMVTAEFYIYLRCLLWSPPSKEKLKIGFDHYIIDNKKEAPEKAEDEVIGESVAEA